MENDRASISHQHPNPNTPLLFSPRTSQVSFDDQGRHDSRPFTPLDSMIPEKTWFQSLCSQFCLALDNVWQLLNGAWCSIFGGKIEALWSCLTLPCFVVSRAIGARRDYFSHSGIIYLYLLLCSTVVFNLVEQKTKGDEDNDRTAVRVRQLFVISCMILAIAEMLYIYLFTYGNVQFDKDHDAPLTIYFRGGLYIFGFLSMGHSVCMAINYFTCGRSQIEASVQMIKAPYIVFQTLFLNRFHQAKIPGAASFVRIVLAHLLGTNLALWFWTLCTEINSKPSQNCSDSYPIQLDDSRKYFYPLFVEYLLLAASMLFQIWKNLITLELPYQLQQCMSCFYRKALSSLQPNGVSSGGQSQRSGRHRYIPSCGFGIVIGLCFAVLFLVLVFVSVDSGEKHQMYHETYSWGIITLYLSQIFACYIVLVSLQSQQRNGQHVSLDHDDVLLYLALAGILLWEGFHIYSLLLKGKASAIDIIGDFVGSVQHLIQTVALVNLRRNRSAKDQNSKWICQCVLFLLTTNLGLWVQDSFFIGANIQRPGEVKGDLEDELKTLGFILRPLIVFFRFHSATCFFHAWSIFTEKT